MPALSDSELLEVVVRMVVPMRREFGRELDVQRFMDDIDYARQIIDEALTSQDSRLLSYVQLANQRLRSPRIASAARRRTRARARTAPSTQPAQEPPAQPSLFARLLRKLTPGRR